jgi:hypothetical protein
MSDLVFFYLMQLVVVIGVFAMKSKLFKTKVQFLLHFIPAYPIVSTIIFLVKGIKKSWNHLD